MDFEARGIIGCNEDIEDAPSLRTEDIEDGGGLIASVVDWSEVSISLGTILGAMGIARGNSDPPLAFLDFGVFIFFKIFIPYMRKIF